MLGFLASIVRFQALANHHSTHMNAPGPDPMSWRSVRHFRPNYLIVGSGIRWW